jgi:hypothetical protein
MNKMAKSRKSVSKSEGKATGSRAQVWHGSARHTSGGLTKGDLTMNKHGRIVSKAKVALGKKLMQKMMKSKHAAKFKSNQMKLRSGKKL